MKRLLWILDDLFVMTAHPRIALLGFREGVNPCGHVDYYTDVLAEATP